MRREEIMEKLRAYFEPRERFRIVILFGSVARGDIKRESDIDVAVLAEPRLTFDELLRVTGELEDLCRGRVDVIQIPEIYETSPAVAFEITREGIPIKITDQIEWLSWREKIWHHYWDTAFLRELNWKYFKEHLRRWRERTSREAKEQSAAT